MTNYAPRLAPHESESVPRSRAECLRAPRPCPLRCRYRLAGEVSCALDAVEVTGGMTLETVGEFFGVTRERIRQIERDALLSLRRSLPLASGVSAAELRSELREPPPRSPRRRYRDRYRDRYRETG